MSEATRKKLLYILLGLAVVWGAWNFSHPRQRYRPGTEPVTSASAPTVDSSRVKIPQGDVEGKRTESWGRDPFKSRSYRASAELRSAATPRSPQEMTDSGWSLTGILYSATAPMAFINGRMVKLGDTINRAQVVGIDKQKVTLTINGKSFDLFVSKG